MKDSISWISLSLYLLGFFALANPASQRRSPWEETDCKLPDGRTGECVKAVDCPTKMLDIRRGNHTVEGRCGFWKFDEIVCCEKEVKTIRMRPAVAACQRYKKSIKVYPIIEILPLIVVHNGMEALPREFPHMVALGYPAGPDDELVINGKQYVCGGTLISEQWVITAAHCVSNVHGLVPVEAVLGTKDLNTTETGHLQRIPIARIVKHPEYRVSRYYHDIALLKLEKPALFTAFVRPTCLMTEPLPTSGDITFSIVGWGVLDIDATRSTNLQKADWMKLADKTNCSMSYSIALARLPNGLDDGMICISDPIYKRKSDTCWGDSGGPLLIKEFGFPPLVGITSFGQYCGSGMPGVYTSVYKYLDWIEAHVWPADDPKSVD